MFRKLLYFLVIVTIAGCNPLNPNRMFKTTKDFNYSTIPSDTIREYTISPNDIIEFRMFSNNGFKLIDLTSLNENTNQNVALRNNLEYLVEFDGHVKLPILGRTMVKGLTVRAAEQMLEEKYSKFYNDPFVMLKVLSRRVIVFPGSGGAAQVVGLANEGTTLIEALALAGGITQTGRAKRVKLIRNVAQKHEVYLIDLSTIEGLKYADILLQSDDIIYVEPVPRIIQGLAAELSPILTIASTILLLYTIVDRISN